MDKIILNMPQQDMGLGLNAVFQVQVQNPEQQVGKEFGIRVDVGGQQYVVVRNLNSYTIRAPY